MKKSIHGVSMLIIFFSISVIFSCGKHEEESTPCPVISASDVPSAVIDAFHQKYADASVETWYKLRSK